MEMYIWAEPFLLSTMQYAIDQQGECMVCYDESWHDYAKVTPLLTRGLPCQICTTMNPVTGALLDSRASLVAECHCKTSSLK